MTENTRTDHAAEAARLLTVVVTGDVPTVVTLQVIANTLGAQVHATLALVEQQRIASRIALATPQDVKDGTAYYSSYGLDGLLLPEIAEPLGLTPPDLTSAREGAKEPITEAQVDAAAAVIARMLLLSDDVTGAEERAARAALEAARDA